MKKTLLVLGFLPMILFAQDKGKSFNVSGKLTKLAYQAEWVYLQYYADGQWQTDSVMPRDGSYHFTGKIQEPSLASLRVKYAETEPGKKVAMNNKRDRVTIFLEPGRIKVSSVDSFSNVQVKGSTAHTEYNMLLAKAKPYRDKMEPLYALYTQFNKAKETGAMTRVEAMIDSIDKQMNAAVYGSFVQTKPGSPIAMYALKQFAGWDIDADEIEPYYNLLTEANRSLPSAVEFKESLEIAKKTGIGKMAMEFTQNDTLDKPFSLSSLRGQYVLIDFWASWCGPCRVENPNVVKVFHKYKNKGFHVLGVSLDRPGQKDKWMKAIHDDGLTWTQVSDLKFWDNEVAKQYGIRAIPQNLLLDPEGKIIAKNVRGEELDLKVGEAIEGRKAF